MEAPKRIQVDLKTLLIIMAFFGVGTWTSMVIAARTALWRLVQPKTEQAISDAIIKEREVTNLTLRKVRDSIVAYSEHRFERMEIIFEGLPGGQKAIKKADEMEQAKRRRRSQIGYVPTPEGITLF